MSTATILLVGNIPRALKALPQWVVWKWEERDGKQTKPPRSAHTGELASSTDRATWAKFDDALKRYETGGYAGIGFVLSEDDPFAGVDLDHCRDPETKIVEPWALNVVKAINSYTEVSPSGAGLRIFVRAALPEGRRKSGDVEMYDRERYLTVTGDHIEGTPTGIEERTEEMATLHREVFGVADHHEEGHQARPNLDLTDAELIEKASRAKDGTKFSRLWNGDTTGYPSQSEADLALCSLLAFWTGRDRDRIDCLFRASGLFRDKWDARHGESTYGDRTINVVLSRPGDTYGREGANPEKGHHVDDDAPGAASDHRDEHRTDWGNAQRLVRLHGDLIRYCHAWGRWLVWDKRRWLTDDTGRVHRLAKSTVKTIYAEAKAATDLEVRKAIASWAMRSEAQARLEAMIISAESELGIPVRVDDLDTDSWLLNVENGTIDLRTGELRSHDPNDLITKIASVKFDAGAEAPVFMSFLDRIMGGNAELIEYLKRTLGHALSGDVSEHRLELWYGPGSNGKSTLTNAVLDLLGDYGKMAAPGLLLGRYQDRHPTERADLMGARFVATVEIGEGRKLAEELVKQLTGGDRISARFMRQDLFEFTPSHKLFVSCNHRPIIKGSDHAIWRRIKLVLFSVVIADEEQDKTLPAKLQEERAGILNWLIEGCLDWQHHGINEPDAVRVATDEYRAEQDVMAAFIGECCTTGPHSKALSGNLYDAYTRWSKSSGEEALSKRSFGLRLHDQGFTAGKGSGGERWWFGIGLQSQQTMDSDTQ